MIGTFCVVGDGELRRNARSAASRGLPWLAAQPPSSRPLAIVGGGPSAEEFAESLAGWPGDIMAINGAYRWLIDIGRTPDWFFACDPQAEVARFVGDGNPVTVFLLSVNCDPAVFDALEGRDIRLCHIPQDDEDMSDATVPGGPSAMTRAPILAAILGYRRIVLAGADCCISGPRSHVYMGSETRQRERLVRCDGRVWRTCLGLLSQAEWLTDLVPVLRRAIEVEIIGDGLSRAMLATGGKYEFLEAAP